MSLFISLLLVLLFVYVLWPIIKVWWALHNARQQARDFFGRGAAQSDGSRRSGYKGHGADHGYAGRRRKIIGEDVGEYVEFEDIKTYTQSTTIADDGTKVKYETEEQITDVDWVDINSQNS